MKITDYLKEIKQFVDCSCLFKFIYTDYYIQSFFSLNQQFDDFYENARTNIHVCENKFKNISSVFRICIFLNGMSKINPKLPYSTINTQGSTKKPSFRPLLKKNNVDFCFYLSLTAL